MSKFDKFADQLRMAIKLAEGVPNPTKEQKDQAKNWLKWGLNNGQHRIVIQVYNSVLSSIKYDAEIQAKIRAQEKASAEAQEVLDELREMKKHM